MQQKIFFIFLVFAIFGSFICFNNQKSVVAARSTPKGKYLYGMGENVNGVLGTGQPISTIYSTPLPVLFSGSAKVTIQRISPGFQHASAIVNNKLYTWGNNLQGQLGDNTTVYQTVPMHVNKGDLRDKVLVDTAACYDSTMALDSEGNVYTWGRTNAYGKLGTGDTLPAVIPKQINLTGMSRLGCSNEFAGAWNQSDLFVWGRNDNGQLGQSWKTLASSLVPLRVALPSMAIVDVQFGTHWICVLNTVGSVYCFGSQTGTGNTSIDAPGQIFKMEQLEAYNITQVLSVSNTLYAVSDQKRYFTWGDNYNLQYGVPGSNSLQPTEVLTLNVTLGDRLHSGAFAESTYVISGDNRLYGWGKSLQMQLGQNASSIRSLPVEVFQIDLTKQRFAAVYPGYAYSLFEIEDIECFGFVKNDTGVCSGHGACIGEDTCNCTNQGYTGLTCNLPICFGYSNQSACSGVGNCTSPDHCECSYGYGSLDCSLADCPEANLCLSSSSCLGNCLRINNVTINDFGSVFTMNRMKGIEFRPRMSSSDVLPTLIYSWTYKILSGGSSVNMKITHNGDSIRLIPWNSLGISSNTSLFITLDIAGTSSSNSVSFTVVTRENQKIEPFGAPLLVSPNEGRELFDSFTLKPMNWPNSGDLVFSLSYYDSRYGRYIKISDRLSDSNSVVSTLPRGRPKDNMLPIRLDILNAENGDVGLYETEVKVIPSTDADVPLDEQTNRIIEDDIYSNVVVFVARLLDSSFSIDLRDRAFEDILNYTWTKSFIQLGNDTVLPEHQLAVVNYITRNSTLSSTTGKTAAIGSLQNILLQISQNDQLDPLVNTDNNEAIANTVSNILAEGISEKSLSSMLLDVTSDFSQLLGRRKILSEPATVIVAPNFELNVRTEVVEQLSQEKISTQMNGTNGFSISRNFGSEVGYTSVAYSLAVFRQNPYEIDPRGSSSSSNLPVVDIKFKTDLGENIHVDNLQEAIMIELEIDPGLANNNIECRYFNETESKWKNDGCVLVSVFSDRIVCACNHTTSFSAFVLDSGSHPRVASKIVQIVFNGIYIVICIAILIGLFVMRNEQPIKSRAIAPVIGISSVLVDAIIQGLIRNSLALASKYKASNAFSYVIMLTANALTVTALFVYLVQQVRFILLENLYSIMALQRDSKRTIKIIRLFISNKLFVGCAVLIYSLVIAYFAILVGISAHYNSNVSKWMKQRDATTTVQVISLSVFMLCIALGIFACFILDIVLFVSRMKRQAPLDESQDKKKQWKFQGVKLFSSDPLWFRYEAVSICIFLLLIIILYSTGIDIIWSKNTNDSSGVLIFNTIVEILMMFTKIVAFGGMVCVASIQNFRQRKKFQDQCTEDNIDSRDIVSKLLYNNEGYIMFHQYCQMEHSLENLLLWKYIDQLKEKNVESLETKEKRDIILHIETTFIANGSEMQVNISSKVRKTFLSVRNDPEATQFAQALKDLTQACMANMSETFTRLSTTTQYAHFIQAEELSMELKETFTARQ